MTLAHLPLAFIGGGSMVDRIMGYLENPWQLVIFVVIIFLAIGLHEWGHAVMATMCGDPTPKADGRVTLNPFAHLDPVGTIAIFLVGFGWGKPVMVQPMNFRDKRWDDVKVAAAGPAMNLFQALIYLLVWRALAQTGTQLPWLVIHALNTGIYLNLVLMVFNLIPIGPLDGSHIMKKLLPLRAAYDYHQFNQSWGMLLMFGLIFTGAFRVVLDPIMMVFSVFLPKAV